MIFIEAKLNPRQPADPKHVKQGTDRLMKNNELSFFFQGPIPSIFKFFSDCPGPGMMSADITGRITQGHRYCCPAVVSRLLKTFYLGDDRG